LTVTDDPTNTGSVEFIEKYANDRQISFAEAMDKYHPVSAIHDPVHGSVMVMADRDPRLDLGLATAELGYSSPSPFTGWTRDERVPELRDKQGLRTYYDMKRADGTVRGALRLLKTPVLAARWFVEPASDSVLDKNIAEFIEKMLLCELNVPWERIVEDALLMCDFGYFCADAETEILTVKGWKTYNELEVGDLVLSVTMDGKQSEWQPVEKVNVYPGKHAVRKIDTRSHSSVTTLNHNWITKAYDTKETRLKTTAELNTNDVVLTSVPCVTLPKEAKYLDDFVELVAWIYTEGSINKHGAISISQSALKNPQKVNRIRTALHGLFGTEKNNLRYGNDCTNVAPAWIERPVRESVGTIEWYLNVPASRTFAEVIQGKEKIVNQEFISELTKAQLSLFVETSIDADGCRVAKTITFSQKIAARLDAFEMACALLGIPTNRFFGRTTGWTVSVGVQTEIRPLASVQRSARSTDSLDVLEGIVWCPTVSENHTWLARRRGTVYYTGNCFEKVYDINSDGKIILKKLAPRHPMDIQEWLWDINGGPLGIRMEPLNHGFPSTFGTAPIYTRTNAPRLPGSLASNPQFNQHFVSGSSNGTVGYQGIDYDTTTIDIPIEKLVVFTLEQEAGDLRGLSILRSAYKHYFYKDTLYKIDAIQKERHGIGVPIIKLPGGFSQEDKALAENLGRNLRTNERAHVTLPPNWELIFAKLEGQPVDCLTSIEHHDMKIKSNILAPFMDESNVNPDSLDVYFKSTRYIATTICGTINHFVIPQLVNFNYARGQYPKLRVRRIGEQEDIRTMSFAFRNFVGANAIRPDDKLEKFLRTELDLPPADPATVRLPPVPGGGAEAGPAKATTEATKPGQPKAPIVGLPRQAATPKPSAGKTNTGKDNSGGN